MSFVSTTVTVLSLLLLFHAGYSAYEFSHYLKHLTVNSDATVPLDIIAETIVATALFAFGQVLGAKQLEPVSFAKWAKGLEREGKSPFAFLERRPGYMNVTKLRDEYASAKK
ncbi:magnesium transporter [Lipomyces tetrasporus]|uniref:Magnesium transporter n=1 Tax=Lipomyces tetrasporus TaxID=54092 RepID=A0AAD7QUU8_9ASCO|nr:magnesium transporter [Lipomyces tetrasporus]KAJ8101884.1 magnesium transporter [Lipomyces tetrasporus]